MSKTEAAVRRTGALVALAATSGFVLVFVPTVAGSDRAVLVIHAIFLIGCAAVLLSPAHRAVAELAQCAAEAARVMFGAPAAEFWTALVPLLLPAGVRATWLTEAAMRRTGALVAVAAVSGLLLLLVPGAAGSEDEVLALYAIFLLGSTAVLLSLAHGATVGKLARLATRKIQGASAGANGVLRWAGFACVLFSAAAGVWAAEKDKGLLLFLLLLVGIWAVSLSMLAARDPPPLPLWMPAPPQLATEEGLDGGAVKVTGLPAAHGADA